MSTNLIKGNQNLKLADFEEDVFGECIFYEGNPSLKKAGHKLPYTIEHLEEYERCKKDIFYFAENYYYILDLDKGQVKIKLRDYQKEILMSFIDHRNSIVNATRQSGKSTCFEIFVCWYVLFHADKGVAILANKAMSSLNILRKIKNAYELLPLWIQSGVKSWNKGQIELENGCRVIASATSSSAIRSFSINVLIIDEMGFVQNTIWSEFFASVYPTISSSKTSKTIFVSTPNGMNHFWRYWKGATEDRKSDNWNGFNAVEVKWQQVPGRDEQWAADQRAKMTEAEFNQEFGGSFLGSALTLVSADVIENLRFKKKLKNSELYDLLHHFEDLLYVYDKPKPGHLYVMSCDSSKQRQGSVGDPLSIQIIDITRFPYKQVACFHATHNFHYLQAPEVIYQMGKYYNWAFAFIENNEIGQAVVDSLAIDFEYENVYYEKPDLAGYRTTKKTKRLGCSTLRSFIEKGKLKLVDADTISQLSTFVSNGKGSFEAEDGYHDDAIMSLIGTLFFVHCPEFDAFDSRKQMAEKLFDRDAIEEGLEEALPAFGILEAEGLAGFDESIF